MLRKEAENILGAFSDLLGKFLVPMKLGKNRKIFFFWGGGGGGGGSAIFT